MRWDRRGLRVSKAVKPSGFRSYESAWRVHIAPRWGTSRIAEVRFSDVQAWVAELAAKRGWARASQ